MSAEGEEAVAGAGEGQWGDTDEVGPGSVARHVIDTLHFQPPSLVLNGIL